MLLINGDVPLTDDEYRDQLSQMIEILEFVRGKIRDIQDLPRTTIGDRSRFLRNIHESLVIPVGTFAHTLQTDLNALIHERLKKRGVS